MRWEPRSRTVFSASISDCLAGIHGRPFLAAHGVDEDNAGDFLRIAERITAHDQAAEGMADKNVRRLDAGAVQQVVQFRGTVAGGARGAAGAAPAKAAAIVGDGVGKAGNGLLNVEPVQIGRGNAGFKENGGAAGAFFEHVEPVPAADLDPAARRSEATVAKRADHLIEKPCSYERCGQCDDGESDIHR